MSELATTTAADHFDPANRAWQRLAPALADHLDVITWGRPDGRPVLLSLVDLASGDTITLAVIDSLEMRDPYALITLTNGARPTGPTTTAATSPGPAGSGTAAMTLSVRGPFAGQTAAHSYAPHLAAADPTVAATRPIPLHHPDQPALPDTAWEGMPTDLAATVVVDVAAAGDTPVAVLFLDRAAGRTALVGPFPHHHAAHRWHPTPPTAPEVDVYILALRPAPPADPPQWLQD